MHQTVFVVTDDPKVLDGALQSVVVGVVLLGVALWGRKNRATSRTALLCVMGVGWTVFGGIDWVRTVRTNDELYRAYKDGKCLVAEGIVHLEHVEPREGHDLGDVVRVGDQSFVISHFDPGPGYTQSVAYGGVLREGASVRVWLYNGNVLRIDRVPKPGASTDAAPDASGSAPNFLEEKSHDGLDAG